MGLIGLQENVLRTNTPYSCSGAYHARGLSVGCRHHRSPVDLIPSLAVSCNTYYCIVFRNVLDNPAHGSPKAGIEKWREYLNNFGFGKRLGSDFFNESRGFVPGSGYYDRIYDGRWSSLT
ncbi:penicillin-binding transpeptidase domain-containing protein, partial [Desulfonatronum sp. SC1]|uniref:penicillin-binding transpeptidase domain-containing protein n=2 Tax=Pseudomonadati TaxID=3379134 RepID=UPI001E43317A